MIAANDARDIVEMKEEFAQFSACIKLARFFKITAHALFGELRNNFI